MTKGRLEAFSDGVIAIFITIMVLDFKVPQGTGFAALRPLWPIFLNYILSFVFLGIYWNNHHHLLQAVRRINGRILWANLHLLFWLSLVPFTTNWMGESHGAPMPTAAYGVILFAAAVAFTILVRSMVAHEGADSALGEALGSDRKGKLSLLLYASAIPLAFVRPWIAQALYVVVALIWLAPDPRIEKRIEKAPAALMTAEW